jgi:benzoyl-CoA reductase/2-hydroxyglutaryl-CoA dehydratase subunit BcrC/BadD/HgdB
MGFAENIKETIKIKIQENLNRDYIEKILGIVGTWPVLPVYGMTFASKSDKYLNIATIRNIKKAYCKKYPVAFGSLFLPYELLHSLDLVPFLPEVMAGFTAGIGIADKTLKEASARWYTPDLCTFHRSASGAVELNLFPVPQFLICSSLACDAAQKTFYIDAKKYNIEDNFYLIDVPYKKTPDSIKYLASQLEDISASISKKMGKQLDMNKFRYALRLSNEFRYWVAKVNEIRKELLIYPKYFNGLSYILPFHALAGTKDAVVVYKNIYFELKDFLEMQKGLSGNKKNSSKFEIKQDIAKTKRILWLHLKPYYKNNIFEILENNNCRVVFEEINHVYWPELDEEKPFESLALKMLSHPLNGSAENRMAAILDMVRNYRIDGVILFSHWGCRHSNGSARIIKDTLRNNNVSTLILDGDCLNKNNSSEGQILTRIQGFMEIINSKLG